MKQYRLLFCLPFFLFGCYDPVIQESDTHISFKTKIDTVPEKETIRIEGSTTMAPIMKGVSEYYRKSSYASIIIHETGSNEGINSVLTDSADIAMASHNISDSLVKVFRKERQEYVEFLLAGDALVFIVNINNPVKKLTDSQIRSLFTGEIKNWNEIGGHDEHVLVLSRDKSSGSFNFLQEAILKEKKLPEGTEYLKDQKEILKKVSREKNAIGYISFSKLDYSIDPLDISFDGGRNYIQPRIETIHNFKYKYYRGLYLYYKPESYQRIKPFLDTVKSDTIQKIIRSYGYIPLSNKLIANHD